MINALQLPIDSDLSDLSFFLSSHKITHRITEEGFNQVLWVQGEDEVLFVQLAYTRLVSGELDLGETAKSPKRGDVLRLFKDLLRRFPVTLLLVLVNALLFLVAAGLADGVAHDLIQQLVFLGVEEVNGFHYFMTVSNTLEQGEWWRFVTPMFLHFSLLHIVFNLLWVWEIGRKIEVLNSSLVLVFVVIVSSVLANMMQYLLFGPSLFGGMSGVVFGMLGHAFLWDRMMPSRRLGISNAIYVFMLVYLLVGFTGVIDLLGLGALANGAHLGGLLAGVFTGGLTGLLSKYRQSGPS